MELNDLLRFVSFIHKFEAIERTIKTTGKTQGESDAEHSYQVAMTAWYLNEKMALGLDQPTLLKYALAHDLPEIYAGDTDPFIHAQDFIDSKEDREKKSLERIETEFPDFKGLKSALHGYEKFEDKESKFIYLVDKVLPDINTYLSQDNYYKNNKITHEQWKAWLKSKRAKVVLDEPEFDQLIEAIIEFIEKEKIHFEN